MRIHRFVRYHHSRLETSTLLYDDRDSVMDGSPGVCGVLVIDASATPRHQTEKRGHREAALRVESCFIAWLLGGFDGTGARRLRGVDKSNGHANERRWFSVGWCSIPEG